MQGSGARRPTWLMLLFLALVVPLWMMMIMMFLNPKRVQQEQQQAPKVFPSLQGMRQSPDVDQAIRVWKGQVEENPKAPDADTALLKVAIAYESVLQPPDYRAAFRAYRRLAERYGRSPFAVHALFRAGQLAERQLQEPDLAVKFYEQISRRQKDEELVVWQIVGQDYSSSPSLQGQALKAEVRWILDGYYREKALYKALAALVRVCGNDKRYSYGLALVLTAILVQGFLWLLPFTRKQYETMRKMQEMAPEMKKIQETFKGDPRRMQTEIFSLYKRAHFNPMTGCFLGMLIQMPFLWAVFAAIRHFQYPLADASFLWVRSLAQPDLPLLVLYCGSMYLTTRYGPGSDPAQAKQQKMMAWLMPVMFLFFFRTWPSGFLLYWLATNLLSMAQRYAIMRKRPEPLGVQSQSPPAAGAERHSPSGPPLTAPVEPAQATVSNFESPVVSSEPASSSASKELKLETVAVGHRGSRRGGRRRRRRQVAARKKGQ